MTQITSKAVTGVLSLGSNWVGETAPVANDTIVIANGANITVDVSISLGANTGTPGHAVTINGNSASETPTKDYGILRVAAGVTLTLKGVDTTNNTLMLVNRYGQFIPAAGSTIVGDVVSDFASCILNKGIIIAHGTAGTPPTYVTFTSPAASVNYQAAAFVISGTPTGGHYHITYGGNTTGEIAYNANNATVQAAIRGLTGLEAAVIYTTGSSPNFTHLICCSAAKAADITLTDSMTGGTHAMRMEGVGEANVGTACTYDPLNNIRCSAFTRDWICNAAGTALGTMADQNAGNGGGTGSAVTFGGTDGSATFADPKTSVAGIVNAGDYFIDFDLGVVYFYWTSGSNPSFTSTYNFAHPATGWWGIKTTDTTDHSHNSASYQYCKMQFMGPITGAAGSYALYQKYSTTAGGGGTSHGFDLQNCWILNCYGFLGLDTITGSAGDPISIDNNTWGNIRLASSYGANIQTYRTNTAYLKIDGNTGCNRQTFLTLTQNAAQTHTGFQFTGNTFTCAGTLVAASGPTMAMPDAVVSGNTFNGTGYAVDMRALIGISGTSGHPSLIHDNIFHCCKRSVHWSSYSRVYNNLVWLSIHHGMPTYTLDDCYMTDVQIYHNLFFGEVSGGSPSIELGYNYRQWVDNITIANNTFAGNGTGWFGWSDCQDTKAITIGTRISVVNNLATRSGSSGGTGVTRVANSYTSSSAEKLVRLHVNQFDYNLDYHYTTRYSGVTTQGTFTQGAVNYNARTGANRNIPGLALFDPNTNLSGATCKAKLIYTSATDLTLAWQTDGSTYGMAMQMCLDSGTASSAPADAASLGVNVGGTLTDTAKTWSVDTTNAACPIGHWLLITGGTTGVGEMHIITQCTATVLSVAGAWGTKPTGTITYSIIKSEALLTDNSTNTVHAGVYLPDLPASAATYEDTGITFVDHSVTGSDPLLSNVLGTAAVDYKFTAGSPAANAGTSLNAPPADYWGTSRPQGAGCDIGFYEELVAGGNLLPLLAGITRRFRS